MSKQNCNLACPGIPLLEICFLLCYKLISCQGLLLDLHELSWERFALLVKLYTRVISQPAGMCKKECALKVAKQFAFTL